MKLEQQVCSLELAKKLKELGVKQALSIFYWEGNEIKYHKEIGDNNWEMLGDGMFCSAFTVAELGEILPSRLGNFNFISTKMGVHWMTDYEHDSTNKPFTFHGSRNEIKTVTNTAITEADARAKMLIYLIENKLHDPK